MTTGRPAREARRGWAGRGGEWLSAVPAGPRASAQPASAPAALLQRFAKFGNGGFCVSAAVLPFEIGRFVVHMDAKGPCICARAHARAPTPGPRRQRLRQNFCAWEPTPEPCAQTPHQNHGHGQNRGRKRRNAPSRTRGANARTAPTTEPLAVGKRPPARRPAGSGRLPRRGGGRGWGTRRATGRLP